MNIGLHFRNLIISKSYTGKKYHKFLCLFSYNFLHNILTYTFIITDQALDILNGWHPKKLESDAVYVSPQIKKRQYHT